MLFLYRLPAPISAVLAACVCSVLASSVLAVVWLQMTLNETVTMDTVGVMLHEMASYGHEYCHSNFIEKCTAIESSLFGHKFLIAFSPQLQKSTRKLTHIILLVGKHSKRARWLATHPNCQSLGGWLEI